jgi:DNA excision repair protein ERCC-4
MEERFDKKMMKRVETEVVVDHREKASGVVEGLMSCEGVSVVMRELTVGDYCVDGTVLFERKSAADFAKSMIDGRLFKQASLMTLTECRPAFLIEGNSSEWGSLGVKREAIQGALITLSLIFDIPVFRAMDPGETATLLIYTGRQLARLKDPNYAVFRHGKGKRKRTQQLRIVQSLPGVGSSCADRMLLHFGSVRACFKASVEQLKEIDGFGPKRSKAICKLLDESYAASQISTAANEPSGNE